MSEPATKDDLKHLEELLLQLDASRGREVQTLAREMRDGFANLNARFDVQAQRLERHAALWQTGRRWSSRMDDWAEKVDAALEARAREIAELRDEIRRLKENGHRSS